MLASTIQFSNTTPTPPQLTPLTPTTGDSLTPMMAGHPRPTHRVLPQDPTAYRHTTTNNPPPNLPHPTLRRRLRQYSSGHQSSMVTQPVVPQFLEQPPPTHERCS